MRNGAGNGNIICVIYSYIELLNWIKGLAGWKLYKSFSADIYGVCGTSSIG